MMQEKNNRHYTFCGLQLQASKSLCLLFYDILWISHVYSTGQSHVVVTVSQVKIGHVYICRKVFFCLKIPLTPWSWCVFFRLIVLKTKVLWFHPVCWFGEMTRSRIVCVYTQCSQVNYDSSFHIVSHIWTMRLRIPWARNAHIRAMILMILTVIDMGRSMTTRTSPIRSNQK